MKRPTLISIFKINMLFLLVLIWHQGFSQTGPGGIEDLMMQGKLDQALKLTNQRLAEDSENVNLLFLKGLILTRKDRLEDAKKIFIGLTEQHPELPEPFNNLAVIYAAEGDFTNARLALQKAINTHPTYATAHENLGDIYAKMASKAYNQALELDKGNETAREKLLLVSDLFSVEASQQEKIIQDKTRDAEKLSAELELLKIQLGEAEKQTSEEIEKANRVRLELNNLHMERNRTIEELSKKQVQAEKEANEAAIKAQQAREELARIQDQTGKAIAKARLEQQQAEEESQQLRENISSITEELNELVEKRDTVVSQAEKEQALAEDQARLARADVLRVREELADLERKRNEILASVQRSNTQAQEQEAESMSKARQIQDEIARLEQQRETILEQTDADRRQALAQVDTTKQELEKISSELAKLENHRSELEQQNEQQLTKLETTRKQLSQQTEKLDSSVVNQQEVVSAVTDWASRWSNKDLDGYLAAYTTDFRPEDGLSTNAWRSQRRDRLRKPRYIRVELDNIRVNFIGEEHAQVTFTQNYQSDTYRDKVAKTLLMQLKNGQWLIAEEKSN